MSAPSTRRQNKMRRDAAKKVTDLKSAGHSTAQIAEATGVGTGTVTKWEHAESYPNKTEVRDTLAFLAASHGALDPTAPLTDQAQAQALALDEFVGSCETVQKALAEIPHGHREPVLKFLLRQAELAA